MTDSDRDQLAAPTELWSDLIPLRDRQQLASSGFARRNGMGSRPAVIVIDAQHYMVGPTTPGDDSVYPSSCGTNGRAALQAIAKLLDVARNVDIPIFYSRFELAGDGSDAGVYARKRTILQLPGWCLTGTQGARIADAVAPMPDDIEFVKKKPSAFFGTPLAAYLIDRRIDTLIVTGGSASNCVRATVFDAASYNLRVIVPAECVFDRIDHSYRTALFDMDRQFADVVRTADLRAYLEMTSKEGETKIGSDS